MNYVCPECRAALDEELRCTGCGQEYPLLDGVPVFLTGSERESSVESHRRQAGTERAVPDPEALVADARRETWARYGKLVAKDAVSIARRILGRSGKTAARVKRKYENLQRDYYDASREMRPCMIDGRLRSANGFAFREHLVGEIAGMVERIQPRSILEVGCGDGINLWLLCRRGEPAKEVAGFDYAYRASRLARQHLPAEVEVFNGDVRHMPLPDNSVDLAFTVHCLEQIPYDVSHAVAEIARVAENILFVEPFGKCQNVFGTLHHLSHDYARHLRAQIAAAGCSEVEFRCLGLGSPVNRSGMLWCRRGAQSGSE